MHIQGKLVVVGIVLAIWSAGRAHANAEVSLMFWHVGPVAQTEASAGAAKLEGSRWKLTKLKGQELSADELEKLGPHAPNLMLDASTHRLSGASGCNRIMGAYKVDGDHLTFGPLAGTMMACIDGMDLEQRFKAVLADVKKWRIEGQALELLDDEGKELARFEVAPGDHPIERRTLRGPFLRRLLWRR